MKTKNFADIKYSELLKDDFKDSEFWWVSAEDGRNEKKKFNLLNNPLAKQTGLPAITVEMVLKKLPKKVYIISKDKYFNVCCDEACYEGDQRELITFCDKRLVNSLIEMYLWLKKGGLL